ncbi:MAG: tRNA (adenosine(37)-N6)-dimethylallyltransferase MiaA [Anaerolineae bacterium]|nr:tRNA (adenosine(37)-N6)-dimethylallyltransferase MiaA [Anaerolineae bacterium]
MRSDGELIALIGATGVGKTALAIQIAQRFNGEIVGADSRQIYRYMDIGTAKPTLAERAAAPHHLIDVTEPDQPLTLAEYQRLAYAAIADIHARGKLPLLVGGTGQYVTAVLEGWSAPEVPPDPTLRAELEAICAAHGTTALFEQLRELDPVSAARIDPHNARRLIRALEVCILSGKPFSAQRQKVPPPYRVLEIGLYMPRQALFPRLDARIERMMQDGLLEEVAWLHERGYDPRLPALSGLGYAQLGAHLRGECSLEDAVTAFKRETRAFVRRQETWFRHHGAPEWFLATESAAVLERIAAWLHEEK